MDEELNDPEAIGRNFSMLVNLAALRKIELNRLPGSNQSNIGSPEYSAFSDAQERAAGYAVKFLAADIHRNEQSPYRLSEDLRDVAKTLDDRIDMEYRLTKGGKALPAQRYKALQLFDEAARDKNTITQSEGFVEERSEFNEQMKPSFSSNKIIAEAVKSHVDGDKAALIGLKPRVTYDSLFGEAALQTRRMSEESYEALPEALAAFRGALKEKMEEKASPFGHGEQLSMAVQSKHLYGPEIDWQAATEERSTAQAAIAQLEAVLQKTKDPVINNLFELHGSRLSLSSDSSPSDDEPTEPHAKRRRIGTPSISSSESDPTVAPSGYESDHGADGEVTSAERVPSPAGLEERVHDRSRGAVSLGR